MQYVTQYDLTDYISKQMLHKQEMRKQKPKHSIKLSFHTVIVVAQTHSLPGA